jgi:fluoroquinolone transport system permease protein
LVFLPIYAFVLALAMRFGAPFVPVEHLATYLAPSVVLFGAILLGTVLGFALIEEREQGTWLLLRVVPIGERALFVYFTSVSTGLGALVSAATAAVYGHPIVDRTSFALLLLAGSLTAPVIMWTIGVLASNKIEGLGVNKIVSGIFMLPALVFVLPMPWQLVLAWLPAYWIYLGLLRSLVPDPATLTAIHWPEYPMWLLVVAPTALSLLACRLLAREYTRRAS